jgi:hypothetical protein
VSFVLGSFLFYNSKRFPQFLGEKLNNILTERCTNGKPQTPQNVLTWCSVLWTMYKDYGGVVCVVMRSGWYVPKFWRNLQNFFHTLKSRQRFPPKQHTQYTECHITESRRILHIQVLLDNRLKLCDIHKHRVMYVSRAHSLARPYQLPLSPSWGCSLIAGRFSVLILASFVQIWALYLTGRSLLHECSQHKRLLHPSTDHNNAGTVLWT